MNSGPTLQTRKPSPSDRPISLEEATNDIILPASVRHFDNIKLLKMPFPKICSEELKLSPQSRSCLSPIPPGLIMGDNRQPAANCRPRRLSVRGLSWALGDPPTHQHQGGRAEGPENQWPTSLRALHQ